jgi:hypothetical protein
MQMKTKVIRYGMAATTGLLWLAQPGQASAEVSDADFNALKAAVQQLSEQVQSLRQTNQIEAQAHQADLQQIQQLQSKLAETQQTAAEAKQKSDIVAEIQSQPPPRAPIDEATVNHNFQILGDAEFQYVAGTIFCLRPDSTPSFRTGAIPLPTAGTAPRSISVLPSWIM